VIGDKYAGVIEDRRNVDQQAWDRQEAAGASRPDVF
jgi:hypothetical protein